MLRWDIEDFTSFPIWGVAQTPCSCQSLLLGLYCVWGLMSQPLQSFGVGKSSLPPLRQVGVYFHSSGQPGKLNSLLSPMLPLHCLYCQFPSGLAPTRIPNLSVCLLLSTRHHGVALWCNYNRSSSMPPLGLGIIFSQLKTWKGGPVSPQTQAMARQVAVPLAVPDAQESGNG